MRKHINFDKDWKFFLGDFAPHKPTDEWGGVKARAYSFGATSMTLNDASWRNITIPHDFVMEGSYTKKTNGSSAMKNIPAMESINSRHLAGGCLEGGIAWYRKHFTLTPEDTDKRIHITFDGVYRDCTVYLNEYYIGSHIQGNTSFFFDITDFVNYDGENVLAVRVDSTGREGWWYEGGGIYRHVWLDVMEEIHTEPWGIFVASDVDLDKKSAKLSIETEINNYSLDEEKILLESVILDTDDKEVAVLKQELTLPVWDTITNKQDLSLTDINLWSLETPYMYHLQTNLYHNGELLESTITEFGLRHVHFNAERGFFLNGKSVRVQGICNHNDHAGVGIALPDKVNEFRLKQLKTMGTNAYRSAHHAATPELLTMCDHLGILVMDETRRMSSSPDDLEALTSLVKRDRNHPSIIIWGIGNEEIFSQDRPETARTTVTMKMAVRKLDPTRPITSAVTCWNGKERFDTAEGYVPVTEKLDVMGFNYCLSAWDDYHERKPDQPILITEESSSGTTRGCYSTCEANGQYYVFDPDNLDKCTIKRKAVRKDMGELAWKSFTERPYLNGIFLWTGMDYRGEPTPLTYPAISSQFGIFDYCGFPKDNYYYYKSWWTDEQVLHIFPHWNHPGKEGQPITVYCYSNLDEVELFVNGKSYGKQPMSRDWYLNWENVIYEPGKLTAKGYKNGVKVLTETVRTTGAPHKLLLTPYTTNLTCGDTAIIQVSILDENGLVVPTASDEIYFSVEDAGEFLGTGNGNPGSHESDIVPIRRAFNGLCQLLVRTTEVGMLRVSATSNTVKGMTIELNVK